MADHHPGAGGESLSQGSLTVLFEDPFWIGLFELADREGLRVCKVTFGAEPSEREIMEFIDRNGHRLRYSQAVDTSTTLENRKNPKRQHVIVFMYFCSDVTFGSVQWISV